MRQGTARQPPSVVRWENAAHLADRSKLLGVADDNDSPTGEEGEGGSCGTRNQSRLINYDRRERGQTSGDADREGRRGDEACCLERRRHHYSEFLRSEDECRIVGKLPFQQFDLLVDLGLFFVSL